MAFEIIFKIENTTLMKYFPTEGEAEVIIPEGITKIGYGAFEHCENFKSVVIPEGVTKISYGTFSECENLKSIVIPKSVTEIGDYAFKRCKNLKSITIPESVTKIGDSAFLRCESLETIIIPEGVIEISEDAFEGCKSLKSIIISEGVTKIGNSAFSGCESLEKIIIPKSVTAIGKFAFIGCNNLKSIVISESITEIGDYAFFICENLKSVVMQGSIIEIGEYAFESGIKLIFCHNDIEISIVLQGVWNKIKDEKNLADFFKNPNIINFKKIKTMDYRYPLELLRFFGHGEQEYKDYISRNIIKTAKYIISEENYKLINLLIDNNFIDIEIIDELIEFAIETEKTEMFVILNNLKAEKNWFKEEDFDI